MFQTLLFVSDAYLVATSIWLVVMALALIGLLKWRRSTRRQSKVRQNVASAMLSGWFCLALLTSLELGFAWLYDTTDSFSMTNVSQRWFEMHVVRNESGFRDVQPFQLRPANGRQRLCFVGDSFTFGHGIRLVADRFSDIVATQLERQRPGDTAVSNLAEPGLSVRDQTKFIHRVGQQGYQFGTVIYVFCLNDIEPFDERSPNFFWKRRHLEPKSFLFRDTYFFNFVYYRVRLLTQPELADYSSWLEQAYAGDSWLALQDEFDKLRGACREMNADLRVVLFPFVHGLKPKYAFENVHRQLSQYWGQHDIPCLDLLPTFLSHADESLTVNSFDAHPNEQAHEIAAAEILKELLSR